MSLLSARKLLFTTCQDFASYLNHPVITIVDRPEPITSAIFTKYFDRHRGREDPRDAIVNNRYDVTLWWDYSIFALDAGRPASETAHIREHVTLLGEIIRH